MNRRFFVGLFGALGVRLIPGGKAKSLGHACRPYEMPRPLDAVRLFRKTDVYQKETTYTKTWVDTKASSNEPEQKSLRNTPGWFMQVTHLGPRFNGRRYSVPYYRHVIRWVKVDD